MSNFQGIRAVMRLMAAATLSLLVAFGVSAQTVRYIHTDGLGSVVLVTDKDRNVIERSEYEPYGKLLNRPIADGPGYTGHVMDKETELTYMQQRYYDPVIGRFLSTDPVVVSFSSGLNFSRYWFANNNPYRFHDLDGRFGQEWTQKERNKLGGPCDLTLNCVGKADTPAAGGQATTSSGNKSNDLVYYKPGVPEAQEGMGETLECIADCANEPIKVTSTDEPIKQHPPGSPHRRGVAADFTVRKGVVQKVLSCAVFCGVKYAQDENKHPSPFATGPHIHIQTVPGINGGSGDLPRLEMPYIVPIWTKD